MMERADFESALTQLISAAELIAGATSDDVRAQAFDMLAFFRLRQGRPGATATSNDELFRDTAIAALTMAGRKEYLAAAALLDQARGLLRS
jgi:hypothetical protein